ncbi:hypothetical protein B296_00002835 [Ensete ventricosum]|uniref:Uncharacterized protein n=1 Tax=Ensete ventricosum TaxID=4639 RepID=A0A427A4K8_ENSVE|nr:hypothetical protein B296_00002835 [Ensete ventricosum]
MGTDCGCFHLVTVRNQLVMVNFDRRRPLSGSINRGRRKKREKKRENLRSGAALPRQSRSVAAGRRSLGEASRGE